MRREMHRKARKSAIPANLAIADRGNGWAGWAQFRGTEGGGRIDDDVRSVYLALIPTLDKSEGHGPAWTGLCLGLEVADDEGNKYEGERISEMQDYSREWHTLILRDVLAATEADENLRWEHEFVLKMLDKIAWKGEVGQR